MNSLNRYSSYALAALRVVTALLFIGHGVHKLFGFPVAPEWGVSAPFSLFWFAAVLEVGGGLLVLVGAFTRPVSFLLSGQMAVAYWMVHAPESAYPYLNGGDASILFCFVFLLFVFTGAEVLSVDAGPRARAHWLASDNSHHNRQGAQ